MNHTIIDSGLGRITLVADGGRLVGLYFPHHWHLPPKESFGPLVEAAAEPVFLQTAAELAEFLAGERSTFDVPIATDGDAFQEQVWAMLKEIPYGRRTTYGELAERMGNKALAQRVGQAVGHNPISIVVPCHRVVGKDGTLTGYAGGLDRKRSLLELEEPAEARAARLF